MDQFGENTSSRYITNVDRIAGGVDNTATQGSPLGVSFIICPGGSFAFQLYEYNRSSPVKSSRRIGRFKDQFEGWFDIRSSWKH